MGISGIRSKQLRAPYGVSRARWVNRTNGTVEIICKGVVEIKELVWKEENLNVAMLIRY